MLILETTSCLRSSALKTSFKCLRVSSSSYLLTAALLFTNSGFETVGAVSSSPASPNNDCSVIIKSLIGPVEASVDLICFYGVLYGSSSVVFVSSDSFDSATSVILGRLSAWDDVTRILSSFNSCTTNYFLSVCNRHPSELKAFSS